MWQFAVYFLQSGYYELESIDEEGWPHFKQLKPMPDMNTMEQENFLKDHILLYFEEIILQGNHLIMKKIFILSVLFLLLALTVLAQKDSTLTQKRQKKRCVVGNNYG